MEAGMHARPAGVFVQETKKYNSDIRLRVNNKDINGKSILNIMAAGMKKGTKFELICDGEDEAVALEQLKGLVESGLGE